MRVQATIGQFETAVDAEKAVFKLYNTGLEPGDIVVLPRPVRSTPCKSSPTLKSSFLASVKGFGSGSLIGGVLLLPVLPSSSVDQLVWLGGLLIILGAILGCFIALLQQCQTAVATDTEGATLGEGVLVVAMLHGRDIEPVKIAQLMGQAKGHHISQCWLDSNKRSY